MGGRLLGCLAMDVVLICPNFVKFSNGSNDLIYDTWMPISNICPKSPQGDFKIEVQRPTYEKGIICTIVCKIW